MTEKEEIRLIEARDRIAERIEKLVQEKFDEKIKIYKAPWDVRRIAWEDSILANFYHSPKAYADLVEILEEACDGEDFFIEFLNSVEGRISE